jgi:aldose 1-epimerase
LDRKENRSGGAAFRDFAAARPHVGEYLVDPGQQRDGAERRPTLTRAFVCDLLTPVAIHGPQFIFQQTEPSLRRRNVLLPWLAAALALLTAGGSSARLDGADASISSAAFGTLPDGRAVALHRLTNDRGMTVELIDYGAAISRITLSGPAGRVDVVTGPADLAGFVNSKRRFGAIVGRYAGRLRGAALIDGKRYPLATNASGVTLHGGDPGFDRALWSAQSFETAQAVGVTFTHVSPDGAQGFPGTLAVTARYTLFRDADVLTLDITAASDRPTVANLTNHVYFNLAGGGSIGCHRLRVGADRRVEIDARKLPTGRLLSVNGGPFDFAGVAALASVIGSNHPAVVAAGGLDEMLVMRPGGAARLHDPRSGRSLTLTTNQPGLQAYTGNAFDGTDRDRRGRAIGRHAAIALEPGHFPDSPWIAQFPSTRVAPGQPLRWHTRWAFASQPPGPSTETCEAP